jgi:hypothetical protein
MKKPLQTHVKTKEKLAERLQISRPTLRKYLTRDGAPRPDARGWEVEAVADYISKVAEAESTAIKASDDLRSLRARELRLRCERLAFLLGVERRKYVLTDDVRAAIMRIGKAVDTILEQKLVSEYPSAVAGLDVPQARIYGKRLGDDIRRQFQSLASEWDNVRSA